MTRLTRLLTAALGSLLLVVPAIPAATAAAAPPPAPVDGTIPRPHHDPFYTYRGATPLPRQARGAVLDTRSVTTRVAATIPINATQVLYRTQDELGRPSVTVTTVVAPLGPINGVVSYLSFYDALGDSCSPSYTFRGGDAGTQANNQQAQIETTLVAALVAQGYAVTIPDFEGKDLHWVAGHESGWSTLDAVRATESFLGVPASTKVGLFGYSGGSIAGEWAAELAPTYAPELTIVGTAIGGIPVDLAHNLAYVNGSQTWSGVIPAALVALGRAYGVDLTRYQSAYGRKITATVADQCIGSFNGAYPGLKVEQLMKPAYRDFLHIPAVTRIVNRLIMGSAPGHPTMPMFMLEGNADGTGDNVMIVKDVQALAHQYCSQGVPIQMQVVDRADHTNAGLAFFALGQAWLLQRMLGVPMINGCGSIPAGNSLAPVALKRLAIHPALSVSNHRRQHDVLRVAAGPDATGATVRFFRIKHGKRIAAGRAVVGRDGAAVRRVRDRNGHAKTRYVAIVSGTADTVGATTKRVAHR